MGGLSDPFYQFPPVSRSSEDATSTFTLFEGSRASDYPPDTDDRPVSSGGGSTLCPLLLTLERPAAYPDSGSGARAWVVWGTVNTRIVTGIATPIACATDRVVWVKATTNGVAGPGFLVTAAEIGYGAAVPADSGATATTPPTTVYYPLGQIIGSGTGGDPFVAIPSGCGSLWASISATGFSCFLATPGDPGASPPVPPSPGGVQTVYTIRWDRV